jgi:hypothetical protein
MDAGRSSRLRKDSLDPATFRYTMMSKESAA